MSSRKYEKRIRSVKKKARSGNQATWQSLVRTDGLWLTVFFVCFSELKTDEEWTKYNYIKHFDLSHDKLTDNIERIDMNEVSLEQFIDKYEKPYKPVIITNSQTDWLAKEKWTLDVSRRLLTLTFWSVCSLNV